MTQVNNKRRTLYTSGTLAAAGEEVENVILKPDNSSVEVNTSNYKSGLYIYKISTEGELLKAEKLLIIK